MLVIDTSALVSLATGEVLGHVLSAFDVVTTAVVVAELNETATFADRHGLAASAVIERLDDLSVHDVDGERFLTSRIDAGEASCVAAVTQTGASFFITDDYRALPELQQLVDAEVALSPIVLRALVKKGVLNDAEATTAFEAIAAERDWLGAPIYRYAQKLFD